MSARQRRAQHRLVALEQPRLGAAERLGEPSEELGVRHRLAARRNSRSVQREIQVAPGGRQIQVLDLARGRQHVVGVECGVGHEEIVDDGEQIVAQEPFADPALIRHRHHRVRPEYDQRSDGRLQLAAAEIVADVAHVQHADARLVHLGHLDAVHASAANCSLCVDRASPPPRCLPRAVSTGRQASVRNCIAPLR